MHIHIDTGTIKEEVNDLIGSRRYKLSRGTAIEVLATTESSRDTTTDVGLS